MSTAELVQGPMFIGCTFNVLLYGLMIAQVYIYYTTYKEDKRWIKYFVFLILLADTANTVFDLMYMYRALITHFGDVDYLTAADWVFATDPAITGIIATLVQFFFAWRVAALTGSWPLVILVCLGSVAGGAGAIATAFEVGRTPSFANFRNFKSVVILWLAAGTITDIIITTVLVYHLVSLHATLIYASLMMLGDCSKHKRKSGFQHTDFMVDRIIRLTLQTGLITSIVATLDLVTFLAYPTGLHLLFNFPLCKLYSNSLMSSLNSRRGWRFGSSKQDSGHVHSSGQLGLVTLPSLPLNSTNPPLSPRNLGGLYDDFKSEKHSSNVTISFIKPSTVHFNKCARPDLLIHVESHTERDGVGGRPPRSLKQEAVNVALPVGTDKEPRAIRQVKDEESL